MGFLYYAVFRAYRVPSSVCIHLVFYILYMFSRLYMCVCICIYVYVYIYIYAIYMSSHRLAYGAYMRPALWFIGFRVWGHSPRTEFFGLVPNLL